MPLSHHHSPLGSPSFPFHPPLLNPQISQATTMSLPSPSAIFTTTDLLTEILSHIPTKPLLRLKTINKQFNTIISSPSFTVFHTVRHRHPPPSSLLLISPTPIFIPLHPSTSSPPLPHTLTLTPPIHSSNGLLLSPSSSPHLTVSNPTTQASTLIPTPTPNSNSPVSIAFDPERSPHFYLICIVSISFQLYDSHSKMWTDTGVHLPEDVPFDVDFQRGVFWKGRMFWLSHTGWTVYYDFDNVCVGSLVLPKVYDEGTYLERFRYFGECCGHLHLVEIRTNCVREFDVLELDDGFAWFVRFRVDLDLVGVGFEEDMFQDGIDRFGRRLRFYAFSVLAVIRGGNGDGDDGCEIVLSIPGKVISYSFKSKVSRLLCNVVDESDKWLPFRGYNAFQFIESLYPL